MCAMCVCVQCVCVHCVYADVSDRQATIYAADIRCSFSFGRRSGSFLRRLVVVLVVVPVSKPRLVVVVLVDVAVVVVVAVAASDSLRAPLEAQVGERTSQQT